MTGPRPTRRPWIDSEKSWLREHYAELGPAECAMRLGRSVNSVQNKAAEMVLTDESRNVAQTKEIPQAVATTLRKAYEGGPEPGEITRLARRWGVSASTVRRWAQRLGFTRPGKTPESACRKWEQEELDILEENAHLSPEAISARLRRRGYYRTPHAVALKRWQEGFTAADSGVYTITEVASLTGLNHQTIAGAVQRGEMKAERKGERPNQGGCVGAYIHRRELRKWIKAHPYKLSRGRVDLVWLIDLLANGGKAA